MAGREGHGWKMDGRGWEGWAWLEGRQWGGSGEGEGADRGRGLGGGSEVEKEGTPSRGEGGTGPRFLAQAAG